MSRTRWSLGKTIGPALICVAVSGCARQADYPSYTQPDALIVLPGAQRLHYVATHQGSVAYDLDEPYPARAVIATISNKLEGAGWCPVAQELLQSTLPRSVSRGWTYHEEPSLVSTGNIGVHEWLAQWQDASGSMVVYRLAYEVPVHAPTIPEARGPLHIVSTLISADTVYTMRKAASTKD